MFMETKKTAGVIIVPRMNDHPKPFQYVARPTTKKAIHTGNITRMTGNKRILAPFPDGSSRYAQKPRPMPARTEIHKPIVLSVAGVFSESSASIMLVRKSNTQLF